MREIYISYRRNDRDYSSDFIYRQLVEHFGNDAIVKDISETASGEDLKASVEQALSECKVMLVVIGPKWLSATNEGGQRCLDNPDDTVRIEIATALQRNIAVIPLILSKTPVPSPKQLPIDIMILAYQQTINIPQEEDFEHHVQLLIDQLANQYQISPLKSDNIQDNLEQSEDFYQSGNSRKTESTETVEYLRRSAPKGHVETQAQISIRDANDKSVEPNDTETVHQYCLAAEQGHADAQYQLGLCYYCGEGVDQDDTEALRWYHLAAEQGNADAQYKLGLCY
jgi:hypothetical protein